MTDIEKKIREAKAQEAARGNADADARNQATIRAKKLERDAVQRVEAALKEANLELTTWTDKTATFAGKARDPVVEAITVDATTKGNEFSVSLSGAVTITDFIPPNVGMADIHVNAIAKYEGDSEQFGVGIAIRGESIAFDAAQFGRQIEQALDDMIKRKQKR